MESTYKHGEAKLPAPGWSQQTGPVPSQMIDNRCMQRQPWPSARNQFGVSQNITCNNVKAHGMKNADEASTAI